ncbi:MAG: 50S ribosomal protein L1 [Candidatus Caldarchaeales archaeon]|jgi:large subunit ribosomal protein L1|nr:50S ribosomal protein L1 [Candidatus Caldarchaeales archaeon]MDT7915339.1 50S ribosomal protein L1 [Candidatus Caldarchaeales archaeon]
MSVVIELDRGVREALNAKKRSFTQTLEMVINLRDVDVSKPEKRFSEVVELPHGLGQKERKIAVFATGDLALQASRSKNVDKVLERSEVEALIGNKKAAKKLVRQYDYFLVEPQLIPLAARALGAALGGLGKSPIPIPPNTNIDELAAKYRRSVNVRVRKVPQVMVPIGTDNMGPKQLVENARTVIDRVVQKLEGGWSNIKSIYFKLTMGSPVKLQPERKK